jgi:hypothetical protein
LDHLYRPPSRLPARNASTALKEMDSSLLQQLQKLETKFEVLRRDSENKDLSGGTVTIDAVSEFVAGSRAAIARIAGNNSAYMAEFDAVRAAKSYIGSQAIRIAGIVRQLKQDFGDGYLSSARELLHAETFADFLEMADHLLSEGYKDAAAVIAGSSLEVHLRNLADKHNLTVELNGKAKKADQVNSDLASASAYSKLDQKNVTAWLDLRNKAAHGHYGDYTSTQVSHLVSQIRDFMVRIPA